MIPIYYKKPFITFGCKGIYEEMEKIGFDVFRDCWNLDWSNADTLYDRVKGLYENYEHMVSGSFRIQSNENFLQGLVNACS